VTFDDAPTSPPNLFVGAVDVAEGAFEVFEDGRGGVDALLASAAVPNLFRAVEVDGRPYWDGLFSQNPPIRHFVSHAGEKPDEIWVVRINPLATGGTPRSLADIADRRNELAGNLSLEQERHMIASVNALVARGVITDPTYKHIELREIALDLPLDLESKLDRDPAFLADLRTRGEEKAVEFLTGLAPGAPTP
jgi:NTE family protein